jgi:hypothetical protein
MKILTGALGILPVVALAMGSASPVQAGFLPVQNLTFSVYSGAAPKNNFSVVDPAFWYRGTPAATGDLVFIDAPGTATSGTGGYPVYGPFSDPPPGGNFVQADGNPNFFSTFKQDISGLVVGDHYTLSFWQAAGQQTTYTGATTEQWRVFLGTNGNTTDPEYDSPLMNTPSQGVSAWNLVTLDVVANATTDTLTFLAWGDGGSTANLPPTVFLAGVNSPSLPEPATLSLFGMGLLGLGGIVRRRRAKRAAAV